MWKPKKPPFRKHKEKVFGQLIQAGKFIHQIGESESLRQKSIPVKISEIKTPEFKLKISYIKKCLIDFRRITGVGRGITAVQIGIPERFAVIYTPEIEGEMLVIINPVITKKSVKNLKYPEVCMSASPIIANVIRSSWIEFEYYDEFGIKQIWKDKENKIYNRVFQHEIDHMEGIINIDKVASKELILESDPKFYKSATFVEV